MRWVLLDNGCFSFINCDPLQNPGFPDAEGNQGQLEFLASEAAKANAAGDLLFVVMHMPTQDDRPGHTEPTPFEHTMGEGSSPENASFESAAAAIGVDAVFAAHVKGQWEYTAAGHSLLHRRRRRRRGLRRARRGHRASTAATGTASG